MLWPVSQLFAALAAARRYAYRTGLFESAHPGKPVVVVGNITVGGSGKTPLVIALVKLLRTNGLRAGVVSRGHGSSAQQVRLVEADSDPAHVGDEPLLIASRARCPVAVCRRRIDAARLLAERDDVDVILADDGLQHYALQRDIEIAVVDKHGGFGSAWLLPAGPLREPMWRLETVDHIVVNGDEAGFDVMPNGVLPVNRVCDTRQLSDFAGSTVHAVAGIAQPQKFFSLLRAHGLELHEHVFDDHHQFQPSDLEFKPELDILMTQKDAVKCSKFTGARMWALRIEAVLAKGWTDALLREVIDLVSDYHCGRHV